MASTYLDLIRSKKIVVSRLTKQFRQGSDSVIPNVAKAINKGELIEFSTDFANSGFSFVEVEKGQIVEKIIEVVDFFTGNKNGIVDFDRTQILSPMRRYSSGLINLNSIMQKKYNPNGEKVFSKIEGEKEILKNFSLSTVLRPSIVYSVDDNFTTNFMTLLNRLPIFPLYYSGRTKFMPIHSSDLVNVIFNVISQNIYSQVIDSTKKSNIAKCFFISVMLTESCQNF